MTTNQIAYWTLEETKRSNVSNERETQRANLAREAETTRHNLAVEAETNRHNVETERLTSLSLTETMRSNMEREALSRAQLQFNQNQLAETVRHNQATELIQSEYNKSNLNLMHATQNESVRHNLANEQFNILELAERSRSNKASESLRSESNAIESFRVNEQKRHNQASENVDMLNYNVASLNALTRRQETSDKRAYNAASISLNQASLLQQINRDKSHLVLSTAAIVSSTLTGSTKLLKEVVNE